MCSLHACVALSWWHIVHVWWQWLSMSVRVHMLLWSACGVILVWWWHIICICAWCWVNNASCMHGDDGCLHSWVHMHCCGLCMQLSLCGDDASSVSMCGVGLMTCCACVALSPWCVMHVSQSEEPANWEFPVHYVTCTVDSHIRHTLSGGGQRYALLGGMPCQRNLKYVWIMSPKFDTDSIGKYNHLFYSSNMFEYLCLINDESNQQ